MQGERRDALVKVIQDWLKHKFLEPPIAYENQGGIPNKFTHCEWLSQTFVVPKKSADFPWRGVVDMRGPNNQMKHCNLPLPKNEDILIRQGGNQMFSILDLKKAFHQQPLHPNSRHITSTYTPLGVYQWKVNVMGLMNASPQF